jgi:hypothetical protein
MRVQNLLYKIKLADNDKFNDYIAESIKERIYCSI